MTSEMRPNKFLTHGKTKVVEASIINPELHNLQLIFSPCSLLGKPDSALHAILNKKWRTVGAELKGWHSSQINFKQGSLLNTVVQSNVWVVHALCFTAEGKLDMKGLEGCVKKLAELSKMEKASVHVSTITTDAIPELVGMLNTSCVEKGISVYFYQEPGSTAAVV